MFRHNGPRNRLRIDRGSRRCCARFLEHSSLRARYMKSRILGRTGLKVCEIGFGAWAIGGNAHGNSYGPTDDAESIAAVRRAVERGVQFSDTADVSAWSHAEQILAE